MKPVLKFACGSIVLGITVLLLKLLAARVSHSAALFSDALESLVNVASAALALYALVAGAKPADRQHPYGHAKVELLSAVATGGLILVAAVLIMQRAYAAFLHPLAFAPLRGGLGLGLVLNAAAGFCNVLWAVTLARAGKSFRSPALSADAQHLFSDVLSTVGIIIGLLAGFWLALPILDPLIAVLIAIQIAFSGFKTILYSLSALLDEAPPAAMIARIQEVVRSQATGALEAHEFRTRQAGIASFLEFHLVVPGDMSVDEAHIICDRIEAALQSEMPGVVTTIHVEPEAKAKQGLNEPGQMDPGNVLIL